MKKDNRIPVYDLCSLQEQQRQDDFLIEPFAAYLKRHPNLFIPHRHNFYHLVLFTAGSGSHTIDFEQFAVSKGQLYFMVPGQVHSWQFRDDVDGYVINFSEAFFPVPAGQASPLEGFSFLEGVAAQSVIQLDPGAVKKSVQLMKEMLLERKIKDRWQTERLRLLLLELFILTARNSPHQERTAGPGSDITLRQFRKLVEQHYASMHLPKDYAAQLYITPNHLNALCNELLGKPAGEVIRDRILLEAKRLLVNASVHINEIAWQLHFADNSYFTKFFKKQTGITPEAFRKALANPLPKASAI
ncbi:AraC family transcriptional regulator [Taibaiella koreensis]|uniref:AraC family transcriptional regulator n=1 Tax=Taibaiella koreensis TaxID=1268548 RepID=UPI000E59A7ED|nr:AraC family transcriptional regulator [Taibaiella koreensis]